MDIILQIMEEKKERKITPYHALIQEVINRKPEAKEELEEMERNGVIQTGDTINSRYIRIVENKI